MQKSLVLQKSKITVSAKQDGRRKNLPWNLKHAREMKGLTQKDMSEHLGIPYQDYQKYEYGLIFPKMKRFKEINEKLNLFNAKSFYNI